MRISYFLLFCLLSAGMAAGQPHDRPLASDVWAPFRPLVGKWTGERTGLGGEALQPLEWKFV